MKTIENYNASFPLAYYSLGTLYAFYGSTDSIGVPASQEYISRYSSKLKGISGTSGDDSISSHSSSRPATTRLNRFYAVVVDKIKSKSSSYIIVMFQNVQDGSANYFTTRYAVNHGCATDGKDLIAPSANRQLKNLPQVKSQLPSGITRLQNQSTVSGITRLSNAAPSHDLRSPNTHAEVSGITRIKNSSTSDNRMLEKKNVVSGITLIRRK